MKLGLLYLVGLGAVLGVVTVSGQTANNIYLPDSPSNTFPDGSSVWVVIQRELRKLIETILTGTFLPEHFPHVMNDYYPGHLADHAGIIKFLTEKPKHIQQLPVMASHALGIHDSITRRPYGLLRKGEFKSVSFTQKEIFVLLVSAFFCEYPKREPPHTDFVGFVQPNFFGLFKDDRSTNLEKIKFFFRYFEEMAERSGSGTSLTFERRTLTGPQIPNWRTSTKILSRTIVTAQGTIEDNGRGMLQVIFSSKTVGGLILGTGATQQEIRFSTNPELLASLLFTEEFKDDEVLVVTGTERFSNYEGYSTTLKYSGPHQDTVPTDPSGRRQTQIVLMDAQGYAENQKYLQFLLLNVNRELNKAYSGFMYRSSQPYETPIATGKWGAGGLNGNPLAKFLIQLMAASEAGREMHMFTFGNAVEEVEWTRIYNRLTTSGAGVARVYQIFEEYSLEIEKDGANAIPFEQYVDSNI